MTDIEDFHKFINNPSHIRTRDDFLNYDIKYPNIYNFLEDSIINIIDNPPKNKNEFDKNINTILQKYKLPKLKNVLLIYIVKKFYCENKMSREIFDIYINFLRAKNCRSLSGILEVAIMTSPYNMAGSNNGCDYDCYFCPNQKGFPRSYIKEEPAVRRAQQMGFNTIKQTHDRLSSYMCNGHNIDKIEIIVLGGTWSSYEYEYQKEFMRDTYYALNTFYSNNNRNKLSLEEEKTINMTSLCKMVGLTIETRPDSITQEEIINFLGFGVTRVQLGVQTTNDYVLKKINRGCYNKDTISAISLLKDAGLKIMIHLMQNLPYSTPEIDKQTFKDILYNPDYQIDEIKVYPTSVTKTSDKDNTEVNTVIEKWYNDGKYIPYSNVKVASNGREYVLVKNIDGKKLGARFLSTFNKKIKNKYSNSSNTSLNQKNNSLNQKNNYLNRNGSLDNEINKLSEITDLHNTILKLQQDIEKLEQQHKNKEEVNYKKIQLDNMSINFEAELEQNKSR